MSVIPALQASFESRRTAVRAASGIWEMLDSGGPTHTGGIQNPGHWTVGGYRDSSHRVRQRASPALSQVCPDNSNQRALVFEKQAIRGARHAERAAVLRWARSHVSGITPVVQHAVRGLSGRGSVFAAASPALHIPPSAGAQDRSFAGRGRRKACLCSPPCRVVQTRHNPGGAHHRPAWRTERLPPPFAAGLRRPTFGGHPPGQSHSSSLVPNRHRPARGRPDSPVCRVCGCAFPQQPALHRGSVPTASRYLVSSRMAKAHIRMA